MPPLAFRGSIPRRLHRDESEPAVIPGRTKKRNEWDIESIRSAEPSVHER